MSGPQSRSWRLRDTPRRSRPLPRHRRLHPLAEHPRRRPLGHQLPARHRYRFSLGQLPYKTCPSPHAPLTFLLHAAIIRSSAASTTPHPLRRARPEPPLPSSPGASSCAVLNSASRTSAWLLATPPRRPAHRPRHLRHLPPPHLRQRLHPRRPRRPLSAPTRRRQPCPQRSSPEPPASSHSSSSRTSACPSSSSLSRPSQPSPSSAACNDMTIAPQLWLFAGAAASSRGRPSRHPRHRRPAQLPLLDHHLRRPAPPPRPRVILGTYNQTSLLWTIPAAIAALPTPPQRALDANRSRSPPPRRAFLWTIASLALTDDPSDRADQLLSLWPHLLILAAALAL